MKLGLVIFLLLPATGLWAQIRYEVVVDEIMSDPSPSVALPNSEWIELKNVSTDTINLQGWHLADPSSESGAFPEFMLQPDSFVIVCGANALPSMSKFGAALSITGFPSLGNDADQIVLIDSNNEVVHAVSYSRSWYRNDLKQSGGWSLEMIDTKNPCSGSSNWNASEDASGGTPGKKNSVDGINADHQPPKLESAYGVDSLTIVAVFDEPLDSVNAGATANYKIDNGLSVLDATSMPPLFDKVRLTLAAPMMPDVVYTLTAAGVSDCSHNTIATANTSRVGIPAEAAVSDLVINEILFNPKPNGSDFVEVYNRSTHIFDMSRLYVANRAGSGTIASITPVALSPTEVFPDDYFVVTEDIPSLQAMYLVKYPDAVFEVPSLPSYPDDAGDVILLNGQGLVVDEVRYSQAWQFKLIDNPEGVSLERIDPDGPSQDQANWHSASATSGYGTPGYRNSQYQQMQMSAALISISPKIFSPDNDGHDDFAIIHYSMTTPGYVGNITIFDAQGRPVRYLARSALLGLSGEWTWDGLDENGNKLSTGVYLIYSEIFDLDGRQQHFKDSIVLARKLN